MVGLDVTHKALVYEEEINEISAYKNKISEVAAKILTNSLKFCRKHGFDGSVMHDPLAMACVIDETVISTESLRVDIETKGILTNGKTVADVFRVTGKKANADVGIDINREKFIKILKKAMMNYDI
jgi:pyrimidine-specific ribonucleoside hydrolase